MVKIESNGFEIQLSGTGGNVAFHGLKIIFFVDSQDKEVIFIRTPDNKQEIMITLDDNNNIQSL